MKYINKKTNVVIDVNSKLSGDWTPVKNSKGTKDSKKPEKEVKEEE